MCITTLKLFDTLLYKCNEHILHNLVMRNVLGRSYAIEATQHTPSAEQDSSGINTTDSSQSNHDAKALCSNLHQNHKESGYSETSTSSLSASSPSSNSSPAKSDSSCTLELNLADSNVDVISMSNTQICDGNVDQGSGDATGNVSSGDAVGNVGQSSSDSVGSGDGTHEITDNMGQSKASEDGPSMEKENETTKEATVMVEEDLMMNGELESERSLSPIASLPGQDKFTPY